jgi:arsenite-transporting ATPase
MMVTTTKESVDLRAETRARFDHIIARLKDPEQSVFVSVVYPESTPVIEAYRAMLDLKAAGIPTQLVVANQVIPANRSSNAFFGSRRAMQIKYLNEIQSRFATPVLVMPLLEKEIHGVDVLNRAAQLLFEQDASGTTSIEPVSAGGARA